MAQDAQRQTRTALIAFGSETGSAEDVAHELGRLTRRLHFKTTVTELNQIGLNDLLRYQVVILATSTTGQGDLPANAQSLWKRLRSTRLSQGCLDKCTFTSFGLGDSSYPNFNWAHRKLHNRLRQLGAQRFCNRGESDEQHPEGIDGTFIPWAGRLKERLLEYAPLPEDLIPIPQYVFLEPEWSLEKSEVYQNGHSPTSDDYEEIDGAASTPDDLVYMPHSQTATLVQNTSVTPSTHWQDVRLLEFHLPPTLYNPGDVLTVFPKNSPQDVDHLIALMDWSATADEPIRFAPTRQPSSTSSSPTSAPRISLPPSPRKTTLRTLLTNHLDLNAVPRRPFLAALAHFTPDASHRSRLLELTQPDYLDEFHDYTTRARRTVLEVLQEFDSVKIPWRWAASIFPTIKGRQFSIASGGALKTALGGGTRAQLLVAIVRYRTVIKKVREGLCTRYLAGLGEGAPVTVAVCKGGMRFFPDRPAVMVGPGTGVAPLRSMVQERALRDAESGAVGERQLLFFGCRNRAADYFFEGEWARAEEERGDGFRVFPAFSRDQTDQAISKKSKVYVQDLIRREAKTVFELLQDGVVYVCGSSGKMPQAVREAITHVFETEGRTSREDAEARLARLEKSGRYQQETW